MKLLSNGISLKVDQIEIKYKACVHFISADNLSAHNLGGYQMSFSCSNMCRHCLVKYYNFRDKLVYKELCIVNSHNINMIKRRYCPFEELPYVKIDSFFHLILGTI